MCFILLKQHNGLKKGPNLGDPSPDDFVCCICNRDQTEVAGEEKEEKDKEEEDKNEEIDNQEESEKAEDDERDEEHKLKEAETKLKWAEMKQMTTAQCFV